MDVEAKLETLIKWFDKEQSEGRWGGEEGSREEIDLSYAEFQCFVRDVWDWSHDFDITKALYFSANR